MTLETITEKKSVALADEQLNILLRVGMLFMYILLLSGEIFGDKKCRAQSRKRL